MTNKLGVVAITRDEAQIWKEGLAPGSEPDVVIPPPENMYHHFHKAHRLGRRDKGLSDPDYFEDVAQLLKGLGRILLVGHGVGKGNEAHQLLNYLERKHADEAKKVVDILNVDLANFTEGDILASAREWVDAHPL